DGTLAVTTGGNDQETFIWRTADGKQLQRLVGTGRAAWSAAWRTDGCAIAWGNTEGKDAADDKPHAESPLERSFDLVELNEGPSLTKELKNLFIEGVKWDFDRNLQKAGLALSADANPAVVASQDGKTLGKLQPKNREQIRCFTW